MASTHIQGIPQRPGLATARTTRAIMERDREATTDNRPAIYVSPLGNNMHLVRNHCNEQPYRVGSLISGATFSPGSEVLLMSNSSHPGEVIAGGPPVGRRGASLAPASPALRVMSFDIPEVEEPPPPPPPAPIIGVFDDGTDLHAWRYLDDGSFDAEMSVVPRPWTPFGSFVDFSAPFAAVLDGPIIVVKSDSTATFYLWDLLADTIVTVNVPAVDSASRALYAWEIPFLHGGAVKYMAAYKTTNVHGGLWSVPLAGGTPTQLSDFDTTTGFPSVFMRYENGATLYWARSSSRIIHFPLDGSTPVGYTDSGNVGAAYCCFAGTSGLDSYWAGNDSGLTEKRQVLIQFDGTNNKLIKTFNTVTGANFSGSASAGRARSVSVDLFTSGVYPHDAAPGTGSVMKLMQPLGATTAAGNDGADPRITLAANGGNVPQYAWLYEFEYAW